MVCAVDGTRASDLAAHARGDDASNALRGLRIAVAGDGDTFLLSRLNNNSTTIMRHFLRGRYMQNRQSILARILPPKPLVAKTPPMA